MIINRSPIRMDTDHVITVISETILIDGDETDLSFITEGAILPASAVDHPFFISNITRTNGELVLTLLWPYKEPATDAERFPTPLTVTTDGVVLDTAQQQQLELGV